MYNSEQIIMAIGDISDNKIENAAHVLGYNRGQYHNNVKTIHLRKTFIFAAALALILALGVTAYAIGIHSKFFHNAFGTGIAGYDAKSVDIVDSEGYIVKTESYPSQERVETDEEQSELLIGEYVSVVNQSVTIGDYTYTVRDVIFDDSGNGVITVDLDNPNGHGLNLDGSYEGDTVPFTWSGYSVWSTKGTPVASRDYVISEGYSDTHISFTYSITSGTLAADENIILRFGVYSKDDSREEAEIIISSFERIPAREYNSDGLTVLISPVGMTVSFESLYNDANHEEYTMNEVTISYVDGSCYKVTNENEANYMSSVSSGENIHITFNRIVDVDSIDNICILVTHIDSQGAEEEYYAVSE